MRISGMLSASFYGWNHIGLQFFDHYLAKSQSGAIIVNNSSASYFIQVSDLRNWYTGNRSEAAN